jgi:TolA-binding protein
MSRVDLHPEDLLDAARGDGTSAPEDRARLEAHLAACEACAFERAVVRDFAAALERRENGDLGAEAEAVAGALADPRVRERLAGRAAAGLAAPRRASRIVLVAAVLLAGGMGAAAGAWFALSVAERRESGAIEPSSARPPAPARLVDAGTPAPRDASPGVRHAPVRAAPPPESPPVPAAVLPAPEGEPVAPTAGRGAREARPRVDAGSAPIETAEEVFARANAARRAGDYGAAAALYDELGRRFPGSREELLSRVTFGTLLLEVLGQPQRALGLFDGYLAAAPGGTMAEEAVVGRALALGRLGRAAEERAAWNALLAAYPDSIHAERARRRLDELP